MASRNRIKARKLSGCRKTIPCNNLKTSNIINPGYDVNDDSDDYYRESIYLHKTTSHIVCVIC